MKFQATWIEILTCTYHKMAIAHLNLAKLSLHSWSTNRRYHYSAKPFWSVIFCFSLSRRYDDFTSTECLIHLKFFRKCLQFAQIFTKSKSRFDLFCFHSIQSTWIPFGLDSIQSDQIAQKFSDFSKRMGKLKWNETA